MKHIPNLVLLGLFVLLAFDPTANAQSKEITSYDVAKMEQSAMELLRGVPYRSIMTSWVYPERGKEHSLKTKLTSEVDSSGRTRCLQENDAPGSIKRIEVISTEDKYYKKIDKGSWQILPRPTSNIPPIDSPQMPGSKPRF